MIRSDNQHGFFLPLTVSLMLLFSSFWLTQQTSIKPVNRELLSAVELQQELLFWHHGVLHFYRKHDAWPINLAAVVQSFALKFPPKALTGVATMDGFDLQLAAVDSAVAEQLVQPLADYMEYRPDGTIVVPIRLANATVDNPHLIERQAATAVHMASAIDFSNFGLKASKLQATESVISTIHSRDMAVTSGLTSSLLEGFVVVTDELHVGPYSLPTQQHKIELLYEALWYCMNVSERCRNAPQVM